VDRANQEALAAYLEKHWQCRIFKMQQYEVVDYAMLNQHNYGIRAWVEFKARKITCNQFSTIFISLHKWERGVFRALLTKLPFYVVVGCLDDGMVICYKFERQHMGTFYVEWWGRTKRGMDDPDVEPVIHIPIELFQPV
jgi:hypothetical protein